MFLGGNHEKLTFEGVVIYVEKQSNEKCKSLSIKLEHNFNDLGVYVRVLNVKTDTDGVW